MFTFYACLSALLGLAVGLAARPPASLLAWAAAALAGGGLLALSLREKPAGRWLLVSAVTMALAGRASLSATAAAAAATGVVGVHEVACVVSDDPEPSGLYQRFACRLTTVDTFAYVGRASLLVTAAAAPAAQVGDVVTFAGTLEAPRDGEAASGYADSLRRRGIASTAFVDSIAIVQPGEWSLRRALYSLRREVLTSVRRAMPSPESAFVGGVALGSAAGMPASVRDDLRRSGLLHILVVSGYNVSVVAAFVVGLTRRRFGWRAAFWGAAAVGALYAILTGGEPPVLRALAMVLLALGARVFGRPGHGFAALLVAATTMAALSPPLLTDPSFQLSAVATAALLWAQGAALPLLRRPGTLAPVAGAAVTSLAAAVATAPVLAAQVGTLPILGVLANLLAQPLQASLFTCAVVASVAALLPVALAAWLSAPATLLARAILLLAHLTAGLPFASVSTPRWGSPAVAVYCVAAVVLAASLSRGEAHRLLRQATAWLWTRRPKVALPLVLALTAGVVWLVALDMPDGRLHVAFLDVGQGDAILITTPAGHTMLVDGGRDPDVLLGHLGRALPIWRRRLDVVAATHADMDHLGGLLGLPRRYSTGALLAPEMTVPQAWQAEWQHLSDEAGESRQVAAGDRITFPDGVAVEVLSPTSGCAGAGGGDNGCSLVLRLTYGEASVLLTADAEVPVEERLLPALRPVLVLKVGHHGSANCTGEAFLDRLAPSVAVISVGDNRYGHPAEAVLQRLQAQGTRVLRTDQVGTVELVSDGRMYTLRSGG